MFWLAKNQRLTLAPLTYVPCNGMCVSNFLFYYLLGLLFSLVGLRYCNRATLKGDFFQSITLLLLSLFIYLFIIVAIRYLSNGCCIFIWWLLYIYLAIMGIILCKRDRIKGFKFYALDNRPWKRTVGLIDAWDHHDFGKWGYHVFCWRVGLPHLLFGAWGCHDFCWFVGLPQLLFSVWDYHIFCLVRGVVTTFVDLSDYHNFCLVYGITTALWVWFYHDFMYVWLLFVCVHGFMCVCLS